MTVVVSVHGTYASGPEHGEKWWQLGSDFSAVLEKTLRLNDRPTRIQPFVWDGRNSEASRRSAATRLEAKILELETSLTPYILIGHSHGGSVIEHAFYRLAKRKHTMPNLISWVTVGTPFLTHKPRKRLLNRLSLFGKSIFVVILTIALLTFISVLERLFVWGMPESDLLYVYLIESLDQFLVLLICISGIVALWLAERRLSNRREEGVDRHLREHHQSRWIGISHPDDEAIRLLKVAREQKLSIFRPEFLSGFSELIALLAVPVLFAALALAPSIAGAIEYALEGDAGVESWRSGADFPGHFTFLFAFVFSMPTSFLYDWFYAAGLDVDTVDWIMLIVRLVWIFLLLVVLIMITLLAIFGLTVITKPVRVELARALNSISQQHISRFFFGSDLTTELPTICSSKPSWANTDCMSFPERSLVELRDHVDRAIIDASGKIRQTLIEFSVSQPSANRDRLLGELYTGNELIHTSYFGIQSFRIFLIESIVASARARRGSSQ